MNIFTQLVEADGHPGLKVDYDLSNAFLAEEDPLELLSKVSSHVVTMHVSDRYLKELLQISGKQRMGDKRMRKY